MLQIRKSKHDGSIHILDESQNLTTPIWENIDDENVSADMDNIDRGLYNMNMLTDKTIENLVLGTVYKLRSLDVNNCLAFSAAFYMLNNI